MALFLTLPLAFYFLLLELVLGTMAVLTLTDARREVPRGFLQFMGISVALTVALTLWARGLLPGELRAAASPDHLVLIVALISTTLYAVFAFRDSAPARYLSGLIATAALAATLVLGLLAHLSLQSSGFGETLVLLSFALAALALGASMMGMLLGHWYLVAPMLSSAPLVRINYLMVFALLVQGALILIFVGEPDSAAVATDFSAVFWIRVLFGIALPILMAGFVWYSCRIRAMRTATGILYLAVASVMMGDVAAKVMFFITSVPV